MRHERIDTWKNVIGRRITRLHRSRVGVPDGETGKYPAVGGGLQWVTHGIELDDGTLISLVSVETDSPQLPVMVMDCTTPDADDIPTAEWRQLGRVEAKSDQMVMDCTTPDTHGDLE